MPPTRGTDVDPVQPGERLPLPTALIAMSGGVASGKSTVARALAAELNVPRLEADQIRELVLRGGDDAGASPRSPSDPSAPDESEAHESEWERSFEPGFEDRVYAELMSRADTALTAGGGLVLDACFPSRWWRSVARALAKRFGLPFLLVECRVDAQTQQMRLAERNTAQEGEGWEAIADRFASRYEPVDELEPDERLAIDTSGELETALREVRARLAEIGRRRTQPSAVIDVPPQAVTFDCWNTLLQEDDWVAAHARRVDSVVRAVARSRTIERSEAGRAFDTAWERHMDQWRVGIASGARDVAYDVLRTLDVEADSTRLDPLVHDFQHASHSARVLPVDGALDLLEALAGEGVRCGLICDTGLTPGYVVRQHLMRLGLLPHLEVQIFSDEAGVPKPDPRVFRAALQTLGVSPDRAVHVGDLRRTDVRGARAIGMGTVRIRSCYDDLSSLPEADRVVDDHDSLRACLLQGPATS